MQIHLKINDLHLPFEIKPSATLLEVLRSAGFFGAKFGGCQKGECGACTVLLDGKPVNSCSLLAAQAEGHSIETIEAVGEHPDQGWKKTEGLNIIQQAFIESGAIQCGYCTPAMILSANRYWISNRKSLKTKFAQQCPGYFAGVRAIKNLSRQSKPQPL